MKTFMHLGIIEYFSLSSSAIQLFEITNYRPVENVNLDDESSSSVYVV